MAFPGRFELPTYRLGGDCSIQLSYENIHLDNNIFFLFLLLYILK